MPDMWLDVDTAVTVPVNLLPLIDDTDFKTRETTVAYNAAGMDLVWNFVTSAGVITQTAVTPTDGTGVYDWTHVGDGIYKIEIPASGGGTINNDTEGYGWFSGLATGVLPWRGPVIGFRASGLNDLLTDSAYSATRGLAGTALPAAAADAAGGLPISDAGGLDMDAILADTADMQPKLGTPAGASISVDIAAVKTDTAAILVDTGTTLDARIPAALVGGRMDSSLGAVAAGVDLSATMKSSVNAEVVDALATDTYAEPAQGTPAATTTLAAKIGYLFKAWRNRTTQTAAQYSLYNDDAATIDHKATFSDDGTTADRGEVATGP